MEAMGFPILQVIGIGLLFAIPAALIMFVLMRVFSGSKKAAFPQFVMKTEITDKGINVPAYLFGEAKEVEVYQGEAGVLIKVLPSD